MISRFSLAAGLFALALLSRPATAAVMFDNAGFESGDFSGWTVGGNAVSGVATAGTPIPGTLIPDNVVGVRTGNFAAFGKFQGGGTPTTLTLEQTIEVEPGVPYSITVRRNVLGSTSDYRWTNTLQIFVNDVPGTSAGGGFQIGPGSWGGLTFSSFTFPVGQTTPKFRLEFGGYETTTQGLAGFSIDDISIQAVPEPSALCVVALVSAAALGRRGIRAEKRAITHSAPPCDWICESIQK